MPSSSPDLSNHLHPLAGQTVVFTGKLSSLGRRDARALVARLGGASGDEVNARTTMLVVGAEGFGLADDQCESGDGTPERKSGQRTPEGKSGEGAPEGKKSNKLKRAEELQIRVVSEEEFCQLAGVTTPGTLKRQYHAMRDLVSRYAALREDHVRYLVKCGVLRPVLRTNADTFFAFADLAAIRQVNESLEQGLSFHRI